MPVRLCLLAAVAITLAAPAQSQERWGGEWRGGRAGRGCCGAGPGGPGWGAPGWGGPGWGEPGWDGYRAYPYAGSPYRPYYAPPVVAVPPRAWAPPVVVVPGPPAVTYSQPPAEFVYWCDNPSGYYPNVTTCNGPWREQSATQPR